MAIYTQSYTFSNGTTADGGQVNTEIAALGQSVNNIVNAQIASNAAIEISKTELVTYTAWTSFTPTMESGATDWNFSSKVCHYTRIGGLVIATYVLGGTVTVGSATTGQITLPVTAEAADQNTIGTCRFFQNASSTTSFPRPYISGAAPTYLSLLNANEASSVLGSNVAASDKLYIQVFYRAA